jgi:hypothetical protein
VKRRIDVDIPVLIERVANNGYRVSSTAPFPFAVEAATKEEALDKVRELMEKRAAEGAELASVSIGKTPAGRKSWGGYLKDDPHLDAWKAAMEAYRDKIDAEEGP